MAASTKMLLLLKSKKSNEKVKSEELCIRHHSSSHPLPFVSLSLPQIIFLVNSKRREFNSNSLSLYNLMNKENHLMMVLLYLLGMEEESMALRGTYNLHFPYQVHQSLLFKSPSFNYLLSLSFSHGLSQSESNF